MSSYPNGEPFSRIGPAIKYPETTDTKATSDQSIDKYLDSTITKNYIKSLEASIKTKFLANPGEVLLLHPAGIKEIQDAIDEYSLGYEIMQVGDREVLSLTLKNSIKNISYGFTEEFKQELFENIPSSVLSYIREEAKKNIRTNYPEQPPIW